MADFKPGDVVQLKSGGPKMTVVTAKPGEVFCSWFHSGEMKPLTSGFIPDVLRATAPPSDD
jgi:uncharacterized protein YodC (DUF2158 family)